jgi:hypothetical protein
MDTVLKNTLETLWTLIDKGKILDARLGGNNYLFTGTAEDTIREFMMGLQYGILEKLPNDGNIFHSVYNAMHFSRQPAPFIIAHRDSFT